MRKKLLLIVTSILYSGLLASCGSKQSDIPPVVKEDIVLDESLLGGSISVAEAFAGGDGTEKNPYQISTSEELQLFANLINEEEDLYAKSAYYVLINDIYLNDISDYSDWITKAPTYQWNSIGKPGSYFSGTFDGAGYTVYGMYQYNKAEDGADYGLFGEVTATIKNLNVENAYVRIDGNSSADTSVGILIGSVSAGNVDNCNVSGNLIIESCYSIGGIIGCCGTGSSISNCTFDGEIKIDGENSMRYVGGIAGTANITEINNCENRGTITYQEVEGYALNGIGGIVGSVSSGSLNACVNNGSIVAYASSIGGIVGHAMNANTYSLTADYAKDCSIINCVNNAEMHSLCEGEAEGILGGIIGTLSYQEENTNNIIRECRNEGSLYGSYCLGGILGACLKGLAGDASVLDCVNNGTIEGIAECGGIVGLLYSTASPFSIENCENNGSIFAENSKVGGILGAYFCQYPDTEDIATFTIRSSNNEGSILSGSGISGTGGIAGQINAQNPNCVVNICACENRASVYSEGSGHVGGILGDTNSSITIARGVIKISDCSNWGDLGVNGGSKEATEDNNYLSLNPEIDVDNTVTYENMVNALGGSSVGGIVGTLSMGLIDNCNSSCGFFVGANDNIAYNNKDIAASTSEEEICVMIGGIIGQINYSNRTNFDEETGEKIDVDEINSSILYISDCNYSGKIPNGYIIAPYWEDIETFINRVDKQ